MIQPRKLKQCLTNGSNRIVGVKNLWKQTPVDVCDKSLVLEKENAEETVGGIMEGKFKPKPGESCGRCDQRPICRWKRIKL